VFSSLRTRREALFTLIPICGFTAVWVLLTPDMDFEGRFQYALLPLVLVAWPGLLGHVWEDWQLPRWHSLSSDGQRRACAFLIVASAGIMLRQFENHKDPASEVDPNYAIALVLQGYQAKDYAMATTEPGILPLYSNWRALDTWGLNDRDLAHGADLYERLGRFHPQIIHLHRTVALHSPFQLMARRLKAYAEQEHFQLAAAFGYDPGDIYLYYVQPGLPDTNELAQRIRATCELEPYGIHDFSTFKLPNAD
jgi:hypothetical protein